jgi:RNAse (barnase) inhibitor barstar
MKAPDLSSVEDADLRAWSGSVEPLKTAAAHANLKLSVVDLSHAKDRAALFAELDRALGLPPHFGHNWDALADVLEDRDWLGKTGRVIVFTGTAAYRRDHPTDYAKLEDIFSEACEFWKELHVAFWVFTVK